MREKNKFQLSDTYKELKKLLNDEGILNNKAEFLCYTDGVFTYEFKNDGLLNRLKIISDTDAHFMRKEKLIDLLDQKGVSFFEYSWYFWDTKYGWMIEGSVSYNDELGK